MFVMNFVPLKEQNIGSQRIHSGMDGCLHGAAIPSLHCPVPNTNYFLDNPHI